MFPSKVYGAAHLFFNAYQVEILNAFASIVRSNIDRAAEVLITTLKADRAIFVCGNGGSSAIAQHFVCDHQKGIGTDTAYRPRIVCLSVNAPLMTAVANDMGYENVFSYPLSLHGRPGDVLVAISSSGNSENVVNAVKVAKNLQMSSIVMTGFNGGAAKSLADVSLHVDSDNYGIVEDVHQSCMHVLAQYIRHYQKTDDEVRLCLM